MTSFCIEGDLKTKLLENKTRSGNQEHAGPFCAWLHEYVQAWLHIITKGQTTFDFGDKNKKKHVCLLYAV